MTIQVNKKLRNNEYYNFQETLDNLYIRAKNKNFKTNKLYDLIINEQNILLAISNLKLKSSSKIPGTDGLTIDHYLKMKYSSLLRLIRNKLKNYKPRKIKRINIQRDYEKTKNVGMPCIIDRIIQTMFLNMLEPICEAKFHSHSFGFRPNRSAEHALAQFNQKINLSKLYYVVSIDILSFFNNINHGKLLKQIWSLGIQDKKVISIISKMLKSDVVGFENTTSGCGIQQCGILTPIFSNIVLNELDWWVSSQWESFPVTSATMKYHTDGTEHKSDLYRSLKRCSRSKNMKECFIVRYGDDFKILCRKKSDAVKMFYATKDFLKNRLHLEINEDTSKIINLKKKSINFLGFKIRTKKQKAKKTDIVVQTNISDQNKKVIKRRLRKEYKKLCKNSNKVDLMGKINKLNSYIVGLHNYFKIATNVNLDFSSIDFETMKTRYNRLQHRIKKTGEFHFDNNKKYGKSKQTRWLDGFELIPVSFVQHKNPMNISNRINKYTEDGRKIIYKKLNAEIIKQIHFMQSYPIQNRSIEYNINRISKYSLQKGKCFITEEILLSHEVHCHHIIPRMYGGDDSFDNLVILHEDIHRLIHLIDLKKISKIIERLSLNKKQIDKINIFRLKCNLNPIK